MSSVPTFYEAFDALAPTHTNNHGPTNPTMSPLVSASTQCALLATMRKLYQIWERILSTGCLWRLLCCSGCVPPEQQQKQQPASPTMGKQSSSFSSFSASAAETLDAATEQLLHSWLGSAADFEFPYNIQTLISAALKMGSVMCFGPSLEILRAELGSGLVIGGSGGSGSGGEESVTEMMQASLHVCLVQLARDLEEDNIKVEEDDDNGEGEGHPHNGAAGGGSKGGRPHVGEGTAATTTATRGSSSSSSSSARRTHHLSDKVRLLMPPLFYCLNFAHMVDNSVEVLHPVRKYTPPAAGVAVKNSQQRLDYHLLDLYPASIVGVSLPPSALTPGWCGGGKGKGRSAAATTATSSGTVAASSSPPVTRRSAGDKKTMEQLSSLPSPNALSLKLRYLDEIDSLSWGSVANGVEGANWFPGHPELASGCHFVRITRVAPRHLESFTNQPKVPQKVRRNISAAAAAAASGPGSPSRNFYSEVLYAKFLMVVAQRLFPRQSAGAGIRRRPVETCVELAQCFAFLAQQTTMFLPQQDFSRHRLVKVAAEACALVSLCLIENHRQSMQSHARAETQSLLDARSNDVEHDAVPSPRRGRGRTGESDVDPGMCQLLGLSVCVLNPNHVCLPIVYDTLLGFLRLDPQRMLQVMDGVHTGEYVGGKGRRPISTTPTPTEHTARTDPEHYRAPHLIVASPAASSKHFAEDLLQVMERLKTQRRVNALLLRVSFEESTIAKRLHGTIWAFFEQFSSVLDLSGSGRGGSKVSLKGNQQGGVVGMKYGRDAAIQQSTTNTTLSTLEDPTPTRRRIEDPHNPQEEEDHVPSNRQGAAASKGRASNPANSVDGNGTASKELAQRRVVVSAYSMKKEEREKEDTESGADELEFPWPPLGRGEAMSYANWLWYRFDQAANEVVI